MTRPLLRGLLLLLLLPLSATTAPLAAQQWRAGGEIPLVARAAAARLARDRDTLLAGWQATAHGMLRFAAVVEHGGTSIERVIRADELRVEVYGEAPNRSKQRIVAWRDTLFAPTPIIYHRDHLGIVANDFGALIRLGNGDEVRDVPHPLSAVGLAHYRFRVGDTIRIGSGDETLRVVAVDVRPADPSAAGVVGRLYLDVVRAALVRFRFTFTAAAYRDPTVASITVELENALWERQHWLPRRQAIAIRRASPLLALPLTTVLRADWTIDDYQLGVRHPPDRFTGPAIGGLVAPRDTAWTDDLASALDALPATQDDIEALRAVAAGLAPGVRLAGLPAVRLLGAEGIGSLVRVNRVEGVALGGGLHARLGSRWQADLAGSVATADGRLGATLGLRRGGVRLEAEDRVVDVAAGSFGSTTFNSLATVIDGGDAGEWLALRRVAVGVGAHPSSGPDWDLSVSLEDAEGVTSQFRGLNGRRRSNPDLGAPTALVGRASVGRGGPRRASWSLTLEGGHGGTDWVRLASSAGGQVAGLAWRLDLGVASTGLPAYRSFVAGGRGSLVGVPNRSLGGRRLARVEVGWPIPIGLPAPVGGRLASTVLASRLTPYLAAAVAGGEIPGVPWRAERVIEPVLGVRIDLWGPLLRLDLGWATRQGQLGLAVDAHPDWWPLL